MTMLEKAARAAMTVCVGFNEEGDDVYVGSNTAKEFARTVLMAVRDLDKETSQKVSSNLVAKHGDNESVDWYWGATDGFGAVIDAILNEEPSNG